MNTYLIVPILNPGQQWPNWINAVKAQSVCVKQVFVIDSGSDDAYLALARDAGFRVNTIAASAFNHGGTRQQAIEQLPDAELVIFLTQDALLSHADALLNIVRYFDDKTVAAVCGRQLPRQAAKPIEAHARIYNYGDRSFTRSMGDVNDYGLKTAFISNSFAAYRVSALKEVGGFPYDVIFGEDMVVAARLLQAGYNVAYAADACVYHSHDYSLWQEFRRYFDMGVFHAREPWIRQVFGGAEGEGVKFVVSELEYLVKHAFWLIPEAVFRKILGYIGFRLGLMEKHLPLWLKKRLAMNRGFFS